MRRRPIGRLFASILAASLAGLCLTGAAIASSSGGVGSARLGNGPKTPPKAPKRSNLKQTLPLISVLFTNGSVTGVSGTAVKSTLPGATPPNPSVKYARCSVNFTHSKLELGDQRSVAFFTGLGCDRKMVLFGQTYLQRSASNVVALGPHFQRYASSEASGAAKSLIAGNPSLYIRGLVNVSFLLPGGSGRIAIYPSKGVQINAATQCQVQTTNPYGIGVHCALYSNRF